MEVQSFMLGRFAGMTHLIVKIIHGDNNQSMPDFNLEDFYTNPIDTLFVCQEKIFNMSEILEKCGKIKLINEVKKIYSEIDTNNLRTLKIDKKSLLSGYQQQLSWGRIILRNDVDNVIL